MDKNQKYTKLLKGQISILQKENRYVEFKSNYQEADIPVIHSYRLRYGNTIRGASLRAFTTA